MKPRRHPWPAHLGPNTAQDRARAIGRGYRAWAVKWRDQLPAAAQAELAAIDNLAQAVGEASWLMPTLATHVEGQPLTRAQVAHLAGVDTPAVLMWGRRGIRRPDAVTDLQPADDGSYRLRPSVGGLYDYDQVQEFLRLRRAAPTREKAPRPCTTRPCPTGSPRSATAPALAATSSSTSTWAPG